MLYFITRHNHFYAVKTKNSLQIAKNSWNFRENVEDGTYVLHFHKLFIFADQFGEEDTTHLTKTRRMETDGIRVCVGITG